MILNTVLILAGIAFMTFSAVRAIRIYIMFSAPDTWFSFGGRFKKMWRVLPAFIIFFLAGYIIYLFLYIKRGSYFDYDLLVSVILCTGAIFVSIVVITNYRLFNMMSGQKRR